MLKRKWIIDNQGRLIAIWKDCNQTRPATTHLAGEPALRIVPTERPRCNAPPQIEPCL